ncbi:MAG: DUF2232 domain-containing protein [Cellulosilyticaceae bacterium]
MKVTTKEKIILLGMLMTYILLGMLGIYTETLVFLFPLLATPLAIFLMSNGINTKRDVLLQLLIIVGLLAIGESVSGIILYLIAVVLPAYMVVSLYRKHTSIPHMIIYIAMAVMGSLYLYVIAMKYAGVDYVAYYMTALEEYKTLQFQILDEANSLKQTLTEEYIIAFKDMIRMQIDILGMVYPALFLIIGMILSAGYVGIIQLIGRLKKWRLGSFRQVFSFTFSKWMTVLLIVALLLTQLGANDNESFVLLGMNLFVFISSLLECLGIIIIAVLLKRKKWSFGLKTLAVVTIVMLFFRMPTVFMAVGFADTLFNFRKVKIIV